MNRNFYDIVNEKLAYVYNSQTDCIDKCSKRIADTIEADGIVHVFGTGHSHMMAEEMFYRAGGLAPINAMLEPQFMLHDMADLGTALERIEEIACFLIDANRIEQKDMLIIVTNSGRNGVPVELAILAKQRGVYVVGIGSMKYANITSRHSSGKKLLDIADVFIDNCSEMGDACISINATTLKTGATSTIVGAFIMNELAIGACKELAERNITPPIFISANGELDSDKYNAELMNRYRDRIRSF